MKIVTKAIQTRPDWYQAHTKIGLRLYNTFGSSRHEAFTDLLAILSRAQLTHI